MLTFSSSTMFVWFSEHLPEYLNRLLKKDALVSGFWLRLRHIKTILAASDSTDFTPNQYQIMLQHKASYEFYSGVVINELIASLTYSTIFFTWNKKPLQT